MNCEKASRARDTIIQPCGMGQEEHRQQTEASTVLRQEFSWSQIKHKHTQAITYHHKVFTFHSREMCMQ